MYHVIVRRRAAAVFAALNRRDIRPVVEGLADRVDHVMYGEHCLAGLRHDPATAREWYERLLRLFPDLVFDVGTIGVRGGPAKTTVFVEWADSALGGSYRNQGVNVIELAWGKVRAIRIHCDTQMIAATLDRLAAEGQSEATASTLLDVEHPR